MLFKSKIKRQRVIVNEEKVPSGTSALHFDGYVKKKTLGGLDYHLVSRPPTFREPKKRVTSGGVHFRNSPPGKHNFKEIAQRGQHCVLFGRPGNRTPDIPHR